GGRGRAAPVGRGSARSVRSAPPSRRRRRRRVSVRRAARRSRRACGAGAVPSTRTGGRAATASAYGPWSPSVGDEAGVDPRGLVEEFLQRLVVTIEAVDVELALVAHGHEPEGPIGQREIVEGVLEIGATVAADVLDHLPPRAVFSFEDHRMPGRDRLGALDALDGPAAVTLEREAEDLGVTVRERDPGDERHVERAELAVLLRRRGHAVGERAEPADGGEGLGHDSASRTWSLIAAARGVSCTAPSGRARRP